MRKRIVAQTKSALPDSVVDKLLEMDAGELDLLVQHPTGLRQQAQKLLSIYEAGGCEAVSALQVRPYAGHMQDGKLLTGDYKFVAGTEAHLGGRSELVAQCGWP
jgi:hypothetical protein